MQAACIHRIQTAGLHAVCSTCLKIPPCLAQQLLKPSGADVEAASSALKTQGAAQSRVRLMLWLSEPATATAAASRVLAEALSALRLLNADDSMLQVLAAAGAPYEWEVVAAALRRRLPRRLSARFLPERGPCVGCCCRLAPGGQPIDAAALAAVQAATV